jgi:hypothetical protein
MDFEGDAVKKIRANFLLSPASMNALRALAKQTDRTMTAIVEDGIGYAVSAAKVAEVEHLGDVPDTRFLDALPHRRKKS